MSRIKTIHFHPTSRIRPRMGPTFTPCQIDLPEGRVLIVGPNGSGKSTLSKAVRQAAQGVRPKHSATRGNLLDEFKNCADLDWTGEPSELVAVDGLADNRAVSPWLTHDSIGLQMQVMRASHGEGTIMQTGTALGHMADEILPIWLDEADVSFDATASSLLMMRLEQIPGQCVVISHSPVVLRRAILGGWTVMESRVGYTRFICKLLGMDDLLEMLRVDPLPWAEPYDDQFGLIRLASRQDLD